MAEQMRDANDEDSSALAGGMRSQLSPREAKIAECLQNARDATSHIARLEWIDMASGAMGIVLRGGFPEDGLSDVERALRDIADALEAAQQEGPLRILAITPGLIAKARAPLGLTTALSQSAVKGSDQERIERRFQELLEQEPKAAPGASPQAE